MKTNAEIRQLNLVALISEAGGDERLAEKYGCSTSYIRQMKLGSKTSETGKPKGIGDETARKLESCMGKPRGWMDQVQAADEREPGDDFVAVERVRIQISAGITGFVIEHIEGNGPPIFFRKDALASKGWKAEKLYALKVSGHSMEPSLYDGDLVVVNSADAAPSDGEVFAVNYEGELVIKRLRRDSGEWWLTSDNADQRRYGPKRCHGDAAIIGRVVYKQSERI